MKPSNIPTALRELAARFESIDMNDGADGEMSATIRIGIHHVNSRDDLGRLLPLLIDPQLNDEVPCVSGRDEHTADITLFFKPGILGGERKMIVIDNDAGLAELLAEHRAAETVQV